MVKISNEINIQQLKQMTMKNKQTEKLMTIFFSVSSILIISGAFLKIMHYPNGNLVLWIGFMSGIVISSFEIRRLKKIIRLYEKDNSNVD